MKVGKEQWQYPLALPVIQHTQHTHIHAQAHTQSGNNQNNIQHTRRRTVSTRVSQQLALFVAVTTSQRTKQQSNKQTHKHTHITLSDYNHNTAKRCNDTAQNPAHRGRQTRAKALQGLQASVHRLPASRCASRVLLSQHGHGTGGNEHHSGETGHVQGLETVFGVEISLFKSNLNNVGEDLRLNFQQPPFRCFSMASGGSPGAVDAATGSKSRPSSESGVGADNMYIAKRWVSGVPLNTAFCIAPSSVFAAVSGVKEGTAVCICQFDEKRKNRG